MTNPFWTALSQTRIGSGFINALASIPVIREQQSAQDQINSILQQATAGATASMSPTTATAQPGQAPLPNPTGFQPPAAPPGVSANIQAAQPQTSPQRAMLGVLQNNMDLLGKAGPEYFTRLKDMMNMAAGLNPQALNLGNGAIGAYQPDTGKATLSIAAPQVSFQDGRAIQTQTQPDMTIKMTDIGPVGPQTKFATIADRLISYDPNIPGSEKVVMNFHTEPVTDYEKKLSDLLAIGTDPTLAVDLSQGNLRIITDPVVGGSQLLNVRTNISHPVTPEEANKLAPLLASNAPAGGASGGAGAANNPPPAIPGAGAGVPPTPMGVPPAVPNTQPQAAPAPGAPLVTPTDNSFPIGLGVAPLELSAAGASGVGASVGQGVSNVAGAFGLTPANTILAPQATAALENMKLFNQNAVQALANNQRFPVTEQTLIRSMLPTPGTFLAPDVQVQKVTALRNTLEDMRKVKMELAANPRLPAQTRKDYLDAAGTIEEIIHMMGPRPAEGSGTPGAPILPGQDAAHAIKVNNGAEAQKLPPGTFFRIGPDVYKVNNAPTAPQQ